MQSHVFFRKYIKGTDNWAADFMSRMYESHKANVVNTELSNITELANIALLMGNDIAEALRVWHEEDLQGFVCKVPRSPDPTETGS